MTAAEIIRAATELSPSESEQVAETLLDSIDGGVDQAEVEEAWRNAIGDRIDEIRNGSIEGLTREETKAFLAERRAARSR